MARVSTIQDVARLAGVSPTTAKRALRDADKLTPETLARVQAAIAALHYEPDQRAGGLRGGQSQTVGLVLGSIIEPFFAQFARTTARTLNRAGYTLIITENEYSAAREREELRRLYGQRVAAIMVRSGYGPESREYLARMVARGVVVVEFDYTTPNSPYPSVMLDNAAAVYSAVAYLHGLGHRRIAALGTYHPSVHPEERSRAFPEAMNAHGLTVPPEYQRVTLLNEDTAYRLTHDLMALPTPPTALVALAGTQAVGAYRALRERGLHIPGDVSLLTFDNYPWTALVDPPITVVEQPVEAMAEATALKIIAALEGGSAGQSMTFAGKMIERSSCGPPKPDEATAGL